MITPGFSPTATERVLPKLALDFTTAVLDPRVTLTRALNTATAVNSSGNIAIVNANLPRFDYNLGTGGACKGLLIEESRINVLTYSQDIANISGGWGVSLGGTGTCPTNTSNAGVSPDGTSNASRIVLQLNGGTASGNYAWWRQGYTGTNGTAYTLSFYAKSYDGVSSYVAQIIDISGNSTGITITPTWTRFTVTANGTGSAVNVGIRLRGSQTPTNSDSADFLIWGAQLEAGAFATSYIPNLTTGTTTRNADVATMTGTNFSSWYNQSAGSFEVEYLSSAASGARIISVTQTGSGATPDNTIYIDALSNVRGIVYSGSSTVAVLFAGARPALGTLTKVSLGYAVDNYAAALNGAAPATDAAGALPLVSNTQLEIGQLANGLATTAINSHMRKINYWPQRLTNAQIQAFSK